MIFGVGIDLIEVARIEKQLLENSGFREKIFTKDEIKYCDSKKKKAEHFAARFAAKEAFLKAIGTGWRNGFSFLEIAVLNDEFGKPILEIYGKTKQFIEENKIKNMQISLSHLKDLATAIVILEK
ncbi:MAG: holo-ACP synthase [Candidatus Cloacimonetes bacterium]|jgi:holo-[acyl-carrier protein] synthase|nr:holo-ACP synthase [Candidatus Cloacimonadota bacterium]MBT6994979.1 holo-ACP synthase [Candidatus Cloacimonadota bacterium]MBT7469811.1 holo-ACP synthase [Candidatus Cloacimonadota bacterium]